MFFNSYFFIIIPANPNPNLDPTVILSVCYGTLEIYHEGYKTKVNGINSPLNSQSTTSFYNATSSNTTFFSTTSYNTTSSTIHNPNPYTTSFSESTTSLVIIGNIYTINKILNTLSYQSLPYASGYDYLYIKTYSDPSLNPSLNSSLNSSLNPSLNPSLISSLDPSLILERDRYNSVIINIKILPVNNRPIIKLLKMSYGILYRDNSTSYNTTATETGNTGSDSYDIINEYNSDGSSSNKNGGNKSLVGVVFLKQDLIYPIGTHFEVSDPDLTAPPLDSTPIFVSMIVSHGTLKLTEYAGISYYANTSSALDIEKREEFYSNKNEPKNPLNDHITYSQSDLDNPNYPRRQIFIKG